MCILCIAILIGIAARGSITSRAPCPAWYSWSTLVHKCPLTLIATASPVSKFTAYLTLRAIGVISRIPPLHSLLTCAMDEYSMAPESPQKLMIADSLYLLSKSPFSKGLADLVLPHPLDHGDLEGGSSTPRLSPGPGRIGTRTKR
jgi:hypothetical protein